MRYAYLQRVLWAQACADEVRQSKKAKKERHIKDFVIRRTSLRHVCFQAHWIFVQSLFRNLH